MLARAHSIAVAKNDGATSFESDCNGLYARGPTLQVLQADRSIADGVVVKRVRLL